MRTVPELIGIYINIIIVVTADLLTRFIVESVEEICHLKSEFLVILLFAGQIFHTCCQCGAH